MELYAILYFQSVYYTVHVKGIKHASLFRLENNRWFYHDELKVGYYNNYVKELIFENTP